MGLVLVVLAIVLAAGVLPSGGFWWDFLAALGYCSLTLIAFMGWAESPAGMLRLRLHRNLAVLATLIVTAHAAGYLVIDSTLLEYLQPETGPRSTKGVIDHLAFRVKDLPSLIAGLEAKGVKFETAHPRQAFDGSKIIFFHGPDGERIELVEF